MDPAPPFKPTGWDFLLPVWPGLLRPDPAVHDALARWAADKPHGTAAQIEFLLRRALGDAARTLTTPEDAQARPAEATR